MRTIIAGGRDYRFSESDRSDLDKLKDHLPITEVVSGKCRGADRDGEAWARSRGLRVKEFPAAWGQYGKAAGPLRNIEMAEYADALIAFAGDKGTADMVEAAHQRDLIVVDWRYC